MSQRRLSVSGTEARDTFADIKDRLEKLESGQQFRGLTSFGAIRIGDVEVLVTDAGGGHRNVTFLNLVNGLSSTIAL